MTHNVAVVAIGRNEGARLIACLDSLQGKVDHIVYVDSGSKDDSVAQAKGRGVTVVELDMSIPFTAARARNTGVDHIPADVDFIQFVDGDCILRPDWIETAVAFMTDTPIAAAVCGRNRERFPEASIYNQLADDEWNTPIGKSLATGGNVMVRKRAFDAINGFNPTLIAGEEPEFCLRLRGEGWEIWRIDAEMTLHDANLLKFSQWWQRAKRSGYVYAEKVDMYGRTPERFGVRELNRILAWGVVLPLVILLGCLFVTPWALLLALLWPIQVLRRIRRGDRWSHAVLMTFVKFPEAQGAFRYARLRLTRATSTLIEHK